MTATERVRELLDERGVEWEDCGNGATYVEHNGEAWRFDYDELFDQLAIVCLSGYTPEQAIAATLGREDTYTREDVESAFVSGYSLGSLPVGSDPQWDENRQTVDEHMAELGWVRKTTLGSSNCTNDCTNSERMGTCIADETETISVRGDTWGYYFDKHFTIHVMECSECGHTYEHVNGGYEFCPHCGRRVVEVNA